MHVSLGKEAAKSCIENIKKYNLKCYSLLGLKTAGSSLGLKPADLATLLYIHMDISYKLVSM